MEDEALFLNVARRIGRRLVDQALWEGDACTWEVMTSHRDAAGEHQAVPKKASGTVYQGTAGMALFLGELHKHTQDEAIGRTAEGAVRHALTEAEGLPENSFGFYSGRVGIAYATAHVADRLRKPEYRQRTADVLAPLAGHEDEDRGLDVIAGGAGAIPALLQLAKKLGDDQLARMAVRLGEHLIDEAHREPGGWSWGTPQPTRVRHLLGFAHGAAGFGHAFLELYEATGAERYRYAAEQAFLYERQFFSEDTSNWPDFRHPGLGEYVFDGKYDELKEVARAGALSPYERSYMSAWCHGAPGIGLTRLRAFEVLGHPQYREEAEAALQATRVSLMRSGNFSLCHGAGGNCETLLYAAEVFGAEVLVEDDKFENIAEALGEGGSERFERTDQPWPCGTLNGVNDPSFMLGEAGIGHFYLRLYAPETPSFLLLRAPGDLDVSGEDLLPSTGYRGLQCEYVGDYFGQTLDVLEALPDAPPLAPERPLDGPLETSDVEAFYSALRDAIDRADDPCRSLLEDATRPERARYEEAQALTDFTEAFLADLIRRPVEEVEWTSGPVHLAPHARLLRCQWDWEAWLEQPASERPPRPEATDVTFLLHRSGKRIHLRRLGPFATLILQAAERPTSLGEITDRVLEALAEPLPREAVQAKVVEQLNQAYQRGVVRAPHELPEKHVLVQP